MSVEANSIRHRYDRRKIKNLSRLYSPLDPYVGMTNQEIDRALIEWIRNSQLALDIEALHLLEIGCGHGGNLQRFIRYGFRPENLTGIDLLSDRVNAAKEVLPASVTLITGNALSIPLRPHTFDVVCLFTVLSSILDEEFQGALATKAWSWVKPGGGILCYDFIYNNPHNQDVRGVTKRRINQLFPDAKASFKWLTLAPPVGRPATSLHPALYTLLNTIPLLRTHALCWLSKA